MGKNKRVSYKAMKNNKTLLDFVESQEEEEKEQDKDEHH